MIIAEYGNSKNITARTIREQRTQRMLAVGHKSAVEDAYTVADNRTERQRYDAGFDAYCRGLSVADLTDEFEVRGYWYANSAKEAAEAAADRIAWERCMEVDQAQYTPRAWEI